MKKESNTKTAKTQEYTSPYDFHGKIPLAQAIPLGMQHVLAMFVGNLTPLMIICGICNITTNDPALYITLLQNAMLAAGIITLIQLWSIGPVGGQVPVIMGTSSGFLGVMKGVAANPAMGGGVLAYGAIIGAGLILYLNAFGFEKTERFFTAKTYKWISFLALSFYCIAKSYSFYTGAHHLESGIPLGTPGDILSSGLILPLNICVGLVVACTMYAFFALFRKGGF